MWPYAVVVNYVGLGIVDILEKREGGGDGEVGRDTPSH